ncbi:hypothetical protein FACS189465_1520 [Clostridia bacterium]|nr:hypothetical protein FACS189465_1520 [Clostridia bacterium]
MNLNYKSFFNALMVKKIIICAVSLFFLGVGVGLDIPAKLGTDPISVFLHGVSVFLKSDIGFTTSIINLLLIVVIFFADKKYINFGTLIYTLFFGLCINCGRYIYNCLNIPENLTSRLIISSIGTLIGLIGLAGFITIDIGIDSWSAITMILSKKINKSFGFTKIITDLATLFIGWLLLGGTVGIMTLITTIIGGPIIQVFSNYFKKLFDLMSKQDRSKIG